VSIIGLIPGQSRTALGAELLGEALLFGAVIAILLRRSLPARSSPHSRRLSREMVMAAGTVPLIIGGASILANPAATLLDRRRHHLRDRGRGATAWVLMVEILVSY
jgi:hypothetical protein